MIVKCPQCSIGYNLPDSSIGDKPLKMRCSRCKHIFAITRRSQDAPRGYQEFTGSQHLPEEFAFLRESPAQKAAKESSDSSESQEVSSQEKPSVAPVGLYQSVVKGADEDTIPLEPKMISGPTNKAQAETPTPPSKPISPPSKSTPVFVPKLQTELYSSESVAWETEEPLELEGFTITDNMPEGSQLVGKFMFMIIVLTLVFLLFVTFRNGWSISFASFPEQIAFAFSGEEFEDLPSEARDLYATVTTRNVVIAEDGTSYLVVTGEVTSDVIDSRSNIILRGRLIDQAGDIRAEVRSPCGKTIDEEAIKATTKGSMQGHYRQGGVLYNCTIQREGSTVFQLIFEDLPVDYDSAFNVVVSTVAANAA